MHNNGRPITQGLQQQATAFRTSLCLSLAVLAGCATQPIPPDRPASRQENAPVILQPSTELTKPATVAPTLTAEETALRAIVAYQDRLYRVAAPLLISNATLCKSSARNLLGFTAKNRHSYSDGFTRAAQSALGLGDRLQVTGVLAGSGAARAGVQQGDILASIEGTAMPVGPDAERRAAAMLGPLVEKKSMLRLGLLRQDRPVSIDVPLTLACAYGIELGNTDIVNSYADGRRILVTRGMADFARNDSELAYVIAREMAHNALGHAHQQKNAPALSARIDELTRLEPAPGMQAGAAVKPYSQAFDTAADRVALYMLARAAYPIEATLEFWQRLAKAYPVTIPEAHTALHPSAVYRWPAIKRTIAAIKAKQGTGKPLVP